MSRSPFEATALARVDPSLDHFARLGLEPTPELTRDAVERAYLEASRAVHPDRFAGADEAQRRRALDHASLLNEAFEVLKSPLRRAEYLVRLGGIDLDSSDPEGGAPTPDRAFLIDMIERREGLEAARGDLAAVEALREGTEEERARAFEAALEALRGRRGPAEIREAAARLVTVRYLDRFLTEIDDAH